MRDSGGRLLVLLLSVCCLSPPASLVPAVTGAAAGAAETPAAFLQSPGLLNRGLRLSAPGRGRGSGRGRKVNTKGDGRSPHHHQELLRGLCIPLLCLSVATSADTLEKALSLEGGGAVGWARVPFFAGVFEALSGQLRFVFRAAFVGLLALPGTLFRGLLALPGAFWSGLLSFPSVVTAFFSAALPVLHYVHTTMFSFVCYVFLVTFLFFDDDSPWKRKNSPKKVAYKFLPAQQSIVSPTNHSQPNESSPQPEEEEEKEKKEEYPKFCDVIGHEDVKAQLREVLNFFQDPEKYTKYGVQAPTGILMEGPPGCGKTFLARALANECDAHFESVACASVGGVYVGATAKELTNILNSVKEHKRSIVFLDEFEVIGFSRKTGLLDSASSNEDRKRAVGTLLEAMDGVDTRRPTKKSDPVTLFVAATNDASDIDKALLRPGRFDIKYKLGLPGPKTREKILRYHLKRREPQQKSSQLGETQQQPSPPPPVSANETQQQPSPPPPASANETLASSFPLSLLPSLSRFFLPFLASQKQPPPPPPFNETEHGISAATDQFLRHSNFLGAAGDLSPAQLEAIANKAKHLCMKRNGTVVETNDLKEALDTVLAGERKQADGGNPGEFAKADIRDCVYLAGKAIVATRLGWRRVSHIIASPRTGIEGLASSILFESPRNSRERGVAGTVEALRQEMAVRMAGKVAEEIVYGTESVSAERLKVDYKETEELVKQLLAVSNPVSRIAPWEANIDPEIFQKADQTAYDILFPHEELLREVANALVAEERMTGHEVRQMMHRYFVRLQLHGG